MPDYCAALNGNCNTFCVSCSIVNGVTVPNKVKSHAGSRPRWGPPRKHRDLGPKPDEFTLGSNAITGAMPDEIDCSVLVILIGRSR